MSLQIHLPLIQNLDNVGISSSVATNHGAVLLTDQTGQFSNCYQFGSSKWVYISPEGIKKCTTACTMAMWINIHAWTSYGMYFFANSGGTNWQNYIFALNRANNNSKMALTISNGSSSSQGSYVTNSDLSLDTWYHIAAVYETGKITLYINGQKDKEYTGVTIIPAFSSVTNITLGAGHNGSYSNDCKINGARLYNHALSAEEIAELAKGLFIHYPLGAYPQVKPYLPITPLPVEYQQIQYIQSTGAQYINTGWTGVNKNVGISTFIEDMSVGDNNWKKTFGTGYSNIHYSWFTRYSTNGEQDYGSTRKNLPVAADHKYKIFTQANKVWCNGVLYEWAEKGASDDFADSRPLSIFTFGADEGGYARGIYKLYYFRVYDGNVCVRDMIPCYRKSDGKPGLYDIINGVFYTNALNGDDFLLGPITKRIPDDYYPVEWIQNDSSAYINTGVKTTANTRFITEIDFTQTATGWLELFGQYTVPRLAIWTEGNGFWIYHNNANNKFSDSRLGHYLIDVRPTVMYINNISQAITQGTATVDFNLFDIAGQGYGHVIMKMYHCRFYDGTMPVRDYVPVVRKSDSKAGLFDLVTDTFYTTSSGAFTAGPALGTTEFDISGNKLHGISNKELSSMYKWGDKRYQAYSVFNGTDTCINSPISLPSVWTMNCWLYKSEVSSKTYDILFSTAQQTHFEFHTREGANGSMMIHFVQYSSGSNAVLQTALEANTWIMVTIIYTPTQILLYKNGTLINSVNNTTVNQGIFRIGAQGSATGYNYKGCLSDFKIYSTVLSANEIQKLYQQGKSS